MQLQDYSSRLIPKRLCLILNIGFGHSLLLLEHFAEILIPNKYSRLRRFQQFCVVQAMQAVTDSMWDLWNTLSKVLLQSGLVQQKLERTVKKLAGKLKHKWKIHFRNQWKEYILTKEDIVCNSNTCWHQNTLHHLWSKHTVFWYTGRVPQWNSSKFPSEWTGVHCPSLPVPPILGMLDIPSLSVWKCSHCSLDILSTWIRRQP